MNVKKAGQREGGTKDRCLPDRLPVAAFSGKRLDQHIEDGDGTADCGERVNQEYAAGEKDSASPSAQARCPFGEGTRFRAFRPPRQLDFHPSLLRRRRRYVNPCSVQVHSDGVIPPVIESWSRFLHIPDG